MGILYTSLAVDYRSQGADTPRKKVARSSGVCMTHSEEPRAVFNWLPNETDYSFGDFMS